MSKKERLDIDKKVWFRGSTPLVDYTERLPHDERVNVSRVGI